MCVQQQRVCVNARPHCRLTPPFRRTHTNKPYIVIPKSLLNICAADSMPVGTEFSTPLRVLIPPAFVQHPWLPLLITSLIVHSSCS